MADNQFEEALLPHEKRTLVIAGRRYYSETKEVCTTCSATERFFYIKSRLAGGDVVLECPICDTVKTVKFSMVQE